jgi:hypothetical protein
MTARPMTKRTAFLLSRGMRVGPVWRAMADELARDYRVVAAIHASELPAWEGGPAELIILDRAIEAAAPLSGRWHDKAAEIERDIGLKAYRAAQSYLLYRRMGLEYYGHFPPFYENENLILQEFVGSYQVINDIFQRYEPDVCFYMTLVLAHRRGVFCYGLHFPSIFGDGKIMLTYGVSRQNVRLSYLNANPELITPQSFEAADRLLQAAKSELREMSYLTESKAKRSLGTKLRGLASRVVSKEFGREFPALIRNRRNARWLAKRVVHAPPSNPYVVVFLQRQPEASTTAQAPRWVDQDKVVEKLATNAPVGWTVLVKENPRTYGARGRRYFGPLLDIPNVRLCHPSVPTIDLLRNCEGIVAVTGTVGLEGILMGKRVVALGRPFYTICDAVCVADDEEEVFPALLDKAWEPSRFAGSRRTFLAALIESVDDFGPAARGKVWPEANLAGRQLAVALRRADEFTARFKISPDQFGWPVDAHVPAGRWLALQQALKRPALREMMP